MPSKPIAPSTIVHLNRRAARSLAESSLGDLRPMVDFVPERRSVAISENESATDGERKPPGEGAFGLENKEGGS